MDEIFLSVIIPVYNTEMYIERCINSVVYALEKLDIKKEILVINDGSSDNSEMIIQKFIKKYPDLIKYYKKSNAGLADTKNVGIKYSKGKYISFIDSDDYIDENFFIDAYEFLKNDVDMIIYDWETIDIDNNITYIVEAKNNFYNDDKWGCIDVQIMPSSCNKIVKKELFENLEFPKGYIYEDLGTTLILFLRSKKIKYLNKPYYKYCIRDDSIMRSEYNENNLQMIDVLEILIKRLKDLSISENDKLKAIYMASTRRYYEEILEKLMLVNNNKKELIKTFCKKIKKLESILYSNIYFKKLISLYGIKKKMGNKLLHLAIQKNIYMLVKFLLTKRIYYNLVAVKYISY